MRTLRAGFIDSLILRSNGAHESVFLGANFVVSHSRSEKTFRSRSVRKKGGGGGDFFLLFLVCVRVVTRGVIKKKNVLARARQNFCNLKKMKKSPRPNLEKARSPGVWKYHWEPVATLRAADQRDSCAMSTGEPIIEQRRAATPKHRTYRRQREWS